MDQERSACVQLYDLTDPKSPTLTNEFIQLGDIVACYTSGSTLSLLTTDGVCACGWSRLDDVSEYIPQTSKNSKPVVWEDAEICILGAPTSVQYVAATLIDAGTGTILDKQVFYGDISDVFYGTAWLAVTTQSQTETTMTRPDVYIFETAAGFAYRGKIDIASILGLESTVQLSGYQRPKVSYPAIVSVARAGSVYRLIGEYNHTNGSTHRTELLAITADLINNKTNYALLGIGQNLRFDIADLFWEEDRAVISVSSITASLDMKDQFLFAEFSGMEIQLFRNDLIADHVSGVDGMYSLGSPYGTLKTLIPMGSGIYLRYNGTPDGLDVYDFSDSSTPTLLYRSPGEIAADCRFEFIRDRYSENIFGIMKVTPDADGDYRGATFSWCIYSVSDDMSAPYSLLAEYSFGESDGFLASALGFETFPYNGEYYCVSQNTSVPVQLVW